MILEARDWLLEKGYKRKCIRYELYNLKKENKDMSFIIGMKCVSTCDTACVEVCPVDCIHGPIDIDGAGAEVATLDSIERIATLYQSR